jgi:two-component system response regulator (stage 0 sporulation protein F)
MDGSMNDGGSGVWRKLDAVCDCGLRVLIAEDDPDLLRVIARAIRETGHEALEFPNGTALVDYLSEHRSELDGAFLVTDVQMPGVNGLEVLAELKIARQPLRTIVITAFPDEQTQRVSRALGASALFAKPFDVEDLCTAIQFLGHARHKESDG